MQLGFTVRQQRSWLAGHHGQPAWQAKVIDRARAAGVGERAYLQTLGEGVYASFAVSILKDGRIVFLNATGTGREAAIAIALAAAARM